MTAERELANGINRASRSAVPRGGTRRGRISAIVETPGEPRIYKVGPNARPMPAVGTADTKVALTVGTLVLYWDGDVPFIHGPLIIS